MKMLHIPSMEQQCIEMPNKNNNKKYRKTKAFYSHFMKWNMRRKYACHSVRFFSYFIYFIVRIQHCSLPKKGAHGPHGTHNSIICAKYVCAFPFCVTSCANSRTTAIDFICIRHPLTMQPYSSAMQWCSDNIMQINSQNENCEKIPVKNVWEP